MKFSEILAQVVWLLLCEHKVSYRRIKREFRLDSDGLEDLRHELIQIKHCAEDEDGRLLVWAGTAKDASLAPTGSAGEIDRQLAPVNSDEPMGQSLSTDQDTQSGAERRPLTVMFCDLADSTALSTRLDPEDYQDIIRTYQETCTGLIQEYDGYVAKFMGDGILVYFGYPQALERNAERAVHSAIGITKAMAALNDTLGRDKGIEIAVRIGIATGMVMVGEIVGEGLAQERTVIGEAPNMAARLQSIAGRNGIVVGALTRELCADAFTYGDFGAHELKGISGLVKTWTVNGLREEGAEPSDHRDTDGGAELAELVGRDEETALLRRAWQGSRDETRGQVVSIAGEAGIGKSALIDTLRAEVRLQGYPQVALRCSPYHTNSAFNPIIDHLKRFANWLLEDDSQARLAKLESALKQYDQPLDEAVPLLAALMSLPLPDGRYPPLNLTPQNQKQQTQDTIIALILETAETKPLLMLWEDLHWADPSTLELLGLLIEQVPTASLLIVLTARPEFVPPWPARSHDTPITLHRLEQPHAVALIARIAGTKPLPIDVVDHIVTKTDGVPLYVEELTKTILGSDVVCDTGKQFELTGPLSSLTIPETLQESLMARLDRLPQVRELAQLGSVLGREFAYEMISSLSNLGDDLLQEGLGQLVKTELLYQRGRPPRARYVFKHALVRDAAYGSLVRRVRQQVHLQAAEMLEARFSETVETHPELLAHHYGEAGNADRAADYWLKAGIRASRASANIEARSNLLRGLDQLKTLAADAKRDERELEFQIELVSPLIITTGYSSPETKAASERAIELCRATGKLSRIFQPLYGQWAHAYVGADMARSGRLAADIHELANEQQEDIPKLVAFRLLGSSTLALGAPADSLRYSEQAWELFDPKRDMKSALSYSQDFGATTAIYTAWAACLRGQPDRAERLVETALSRAWEVEHANSLAFTLNVSTIIAYVRRDRQAAMQHLNDLQAVAEEHALPVFRAIAMLFQAAISGWQHRPQEGLEKFEQGIEMASAIRFAAYQPLWALIKSDLLIDLERPDAALSTIADGLEMITTTSEHWADAELHRARGEILISQRRDKEAETALSDALGIARDQGAIWWELRTATSLARIWGRQSREADAHTLLSEIYDRFSEGFATPDLQEAKALLGNLAPDTAAACGTDA